MIAAIDWVIQNKNSNGMNIRVINLAFGTDSTQSYVLDPLAYAVEKAWHAGFVVVVAARNDGNNNPLRNPALDPDVIAVGAVDLDGTNSPMDDFVSDFSNCGTIERHVDVVAPGRSITSLRAPGSVADPGPRHRPPRTRRRRARRRAGHHGKLLGGFGTIVTKCWKEGKGKTAVAVCEDYYENADTLWNGCDWNGTSLVGSLLVERRLGRLRQRSPLGLNTEHFGRMEAAG